jgi:hypothetical protein
MYLLKKFSGMMAGIEYAVILADQFILGILADGAELVVHVSNCALDVGHSHDSVLIQGELLVGQFFVPILAESAGFLHRIPGSPRNETCRPARSAVCAQLPEKV